MNETVAVNPCWCCDVPPSELGTDHPWPCTCIDAQICIKDGCWKCYAHCEHEEPDNFAERIRGWLVGMAKNPKMHKPTSPLFPGNVLASGDFHVTSDTDPELFEPDLSWLDGWRIRMNMRTAIQAASLIFACAFAVTIPWSMAASDGENVVIAFSLMIASLGILVWLGRIEFPDDV